MTNTKPFQVPDETVMLTTMVLQDIKGVLVKQKNDKTVVIRADTPNDYYWAMFDPLDENQWLDEDYGDIREMPLFATRIADDKQKALELLKDKGVVTRLRVNSTQEDPENMGWKDYFVTNSFEVDINLIKFLKYYENYVKAAKPALTEYLIRSGRLPAKETTTSPKTKDSSPIPDIAPAQATTERAKVEPRSYDRANGILMLAGKRVHIIKQPNRKGTQRESREARLMRLLFEDVNSNFGVVAMRTVVSVRSYDFNPKHRKLVKSYAKEINNKISLETGIKEFLVTNQLTVMIDERYLT